jgi:hypothetical protein
MQEITGELIETLLNQGEGDGLDYKSGQYPFAGATDEQKAELLKDMLAMANAWKIADAFILIGVQENPGNRAIVVGASEHIDDADLQQFINSKTNTPIRFGYRVFTIDGAQIGILQIAHEQRRPIWLEKSYGKLSAGTVHVRRGSSTTIADPDEIARMGAAAEKTKAAAEVPRLAISIGRYDEYGAHFKLTTQRLSFTGSPVVDRKASEGPLVIRKLPMGPLPAQILEWTREMATMGMLVLRAENTSSVTVMDPKLELRIPWAQGVTVYNSATLPPRPRSLLEDIKPIADGAHAPEVFEDESGWYVCDGLDKVQPGTSSHSHEFWIGCEHPVILQLQARISADNLPSPITSALTVEIEVEDAEADQRGTVFEFRMKFKVEE